MKKGIKLSILLLVFLLAAILGWRTYNTINRKEKAKKELQSMPALNFTYIKRGTLTYDRPVIINFFDPDCDHCQYMATQIRDSSARFSESAMIMVTEAKEEQVKKFAGEYHLDQLPFLSMAVDTTAEFYQKFGTRVVPCFFIYDKAHQLVQSIKGETRIENIINAIQ